MYPWAIDHGPWTALTVDRGLHAPAFAVGRPGSMVDAFIVFYSLWPEAVQLDALPRTYEL